MKLRIPRPRYQVVEVYGRHETVVDVYWTRWAAERRARKSRRLARFYGLPSVVSEALHYKVVQR